MAGVEVNVTIEGDPDLLGELHEQLSGLLRDSRKRLVVVRQPGACALCVANQDPERVLRGRLHRLCRCTVAEVDDTRRRS